MVVSECGLLHDVTRVGPAQTRSFRRRLFERSIGVGRSRVGTAATADEGRRKDAWRSVEGSHLQAGSSDEPTWSLNKPGCTLRTSSIGLPMFVKGCASGCSVGAVDGVG